MLSVLRYRNYFLLWIGGLVSEIGTYMLRAALPYYVYATSHSVTASGIALISEIVPGVLLNTVGGVYADRLPRKRFMAAGNGVRGVLLLPLIVVHGTSTLWIVYVTGFLSAAVAAFVGPFGNAALPHVVPPKDLAAANATFSVATNVAIIVGAPIGGLLLQHVGLTDIVLINCLSFLVPTIAISQITIPLEDVNRHDGTAVARGSPLSEWMQGWVYVRRTPWLLALFVAAMVVFFGNGMVSVVMVPFIKRVIHGSPSFYSLTLAVSAASGIGAGLVMGWIGRLATPVWSVSLGLFGFGLTDVCVALAASRIAMLVASVSIGLLGLVIVANLTTIVQAGTVDSYRGRVSGAYTSAIGATSLCGATLATVVTDSIGIRVMFAVGGCIFMLGALITLFAVVPRIARSQPYAEVGAHRSRESP